MKKYHSTTAVMVLVLAAPQAYDRAMRAGLAAVLVGCLAAGVGAAAAAQPPPTDAVLLMRHRPLLVLHPLERFTPSPVEPFIAGSDLLERAADGTWGSGPPSHRCRGCVPSRRARLLPRDAIAAVDCYAPLAGPPTAYGAVHRRGGRIVVQYWLFYPVQPLEPGRPAELGVLAGHEGDWEEVSVLLDTRGRPLAAGVSRHCAGVRREWSKVPRRGSRPVVYVALGSHANGFRAGTSVLDPACWPKEAVAVYKAYGVRMLDHAAAGRTVSPAVVRVGAASPAWMRFPGTWGEDQYAGFPNVFRFGTGPRGPIFRDDWRDPARGPLTWPRARAVRHEPRRRRGGRLQGFRASRIREERIATAQ